MLLDGFQAVKLGNYHVLPVIFINLNLPPEVRYRNENILLSCIVPGPHQPGDLNSFLYPMVQDLRQVGEGIPDVLNISTNSRFILRAYVIMLAGDGPALADAMMFKRPGNAISPCHHCNIKGTLKANGKYAIAHTDENIDNPDMRQNLRPALDLWSRLPKGQQDALGTEKGITGVSILLELPTLHFPGSFPLDLMHCVLLNQMRLLYKVLGGPTDDKSSTQNSVPPVAGVPTSKQWKAISLLQEASRKTIPTFLGRAPRSIVKHNKGYKAFEWEAFLVRDGIALLAQLGKEFEPHLTNFRLLRKIYQTAKKGPIARADVDQLRVDCRQYVRTFEKLYYRGEPERLSVCRINTHALLHLGNPSLHRRQSFLARPRQKLTDL
jgi:hypothetical protein